MDRIDEKKEFLITSLDPMEFTLIEDYCDDSWDSSFSDDTYDSDLECNDLECNDLECNDLERSDLEQSENESNLEDEPIEEVIERIKLNETIRPNIVHNYSTVEYISVIFGLLFIINQVMLLSNLIN